MDVISTINGSDGAQVFGRGANGGRCVGWALSVPDGRLFAAAPEMRERLAQHVVDLTEAAKIFRAKGLPSLASLLDESAARTSALIARIDGESLGASAGGDGA